MNIKIGQIIINSNGGGAERVAVSNHFMLQQYGLESRLFSIEPANDKGEAVPVIPLSNSKKLTVLNVWWAAKTLRFYLKRESITHLHAHCEPAELVMALSVLFRSDIHLIVTEHIDRPWANHPMLGRVVRRYLIMKGTKFVGCRKFDHLERLGLPVKVIPNPLREPFVNPPKQNQCMRLRRIFLPQRLIRRKNLEDIFFAVSRMKSPVPIVVLGDGEHRSFLENKARELDLDVDFLGFHENPWNNYQPGDLVISASQHEGDPLAIIEAIALDAPILLSNIEGHKFAISKKTQCFSNFSELEHILRELAENRISLSDFQSEALFRMDFLKKRNPTTIVQQWISLYSKLKLSDA